MKYGLGVAVVLLGVSGVFLFVYVPGTAPPRPVIVPAAAAAPAETDPAEVHRFCGQCHAYPPPDTFPRAHWRREVRMAYDFHRASAYRDAAPDMEGVVAYYEKRAPAALPAPQKLPIAAAPLPVALHATGWSPPGASASPDVMNVHLAHLFRADRLDLIVCEARPGRIWAVKPYEDPPSWHLLATVLTPCHVEVVDLDRDGRNDLVVADLGARHATDDRTGSVIWLRNDGDGHFTPVTLFEGMGRIADVQVADLNGDGRLDLVVAEFGWRHGAVLYLENRTTDWQKPQFERKVLDARPGAIHVPIGDIDGDGRLDVVALISQEHETIVAFLGDGKGGFTPKRLYSAPHPGYGSSGMQLVDLDGDGDLDILYTNGDTLDPPHLLKPYHGVQWLENRGKDGFVHHPLTAQYGAMRAVAADIDGDGALDIISAAYLPVELGPSAKAAGAEALQVLRQVAPGKFERHVLAAGDCNHFSRAAGDVFGDGRVHLVTGNLTLGPQAPRPELVTVWKNLGRKKS